MTFRRLNRVGFFERTVLPKLGLFPWECALCRNKVFRPYQNEAEVTQGSMTPYPSPGSSSLAANIGNMPSNAPFVASRDRAA